nr:hypothetical protein [Tanacetum cinerariifolium]
MMLYADALIVTGLIVSRDRCKLLLHAWYLDDGTVIGDSKEVARVLDNIKVCGPGLGLELNVNKKEIFWPSCNGVKLREGLFPVDIRSPSFCVKLLRGAVSRDPDFISGMAMRRVTNSINLMNLLSQIHDPQSLRGSIENTMFCEGPFFEDLQWRLASLPIRLGGLGFYSTKEASSYAFVASRAQSWVLQDHILLDSGICGMNEDYVSTLACLRDPIPSFDFSCFTNKDTAPSKAQQTLAIDLFSETVKDMEVHFDMTVRQKAVFECLRAPVAQDFLLRGVGISAKKESPINFLTGPSNERSTLRLADVLVFRWVRGKHACVDLTVVSPLVRSSSRGFTMGQTGLKAASYKVIKHEKTCIENQLVFIPFAFDICGFLAPEAVELLNRVHRVMNSNAMTHGSTNFVFRVEAVLDSEGGGEAW